MRFLDATGLAYFGGKIRTALAGKQDRLTGSAGQLIGIGDDGAASATVYPCNETLLINGCFIGGGSQQGEGRLPINQLGKTEYTDPGYTIDRWKIESSDVTLRLTNDGAELSTGSIDDTAICLRQHLEDKMLIGQKYTLSILAEVKSGVWHLSYGDTVISDGITATTTTIASGEETPLIYVWTDSRDARIIIKAMKFELGDQQTLAHKEGDNWVLNDPPPNYQLELAKCQKYCWAFGTNTLLGLAIPYASGDKCHILIPVNGMVKKPVLVENNATVTFGSSDAIVNVSNMSVFAYHNGMVQLNCSHSISSPQLATVIWNSPAKVILDAN